MTLSSRSRLKSQTAANSRRLVVIIGPTASGKTDVAIRLAKEYQGEIICADSRTIYKGMDIGTAKPTLEEQALVPHYGLDLVEPNEQYSVAQFQAYADQKINQIWQKNKPVILVGGSGMYIDAVLFGYQFRSELQDRVAVESMSREELVMLAEKLFPQALDAIDVKNTRRLQQLILRGPFLSADRAHLKYHAKIIGISLEKAKLQMRIRKRANEMLKNGFVQEYKRLKRAWGADCPALKTTGYATIGRYLSAELGEERLEEEIVRDSMRLVKKQMTWFKRNPHIEWADSSDAAFKQAAFYLTD